MSTVPPVRIFVSYARDDDKKLLTEFLNHTSSLKDQPGVERFYDGMISSGKWEEQLLTHLDNADIFVVLLTPEYRNSRYAYPKEFRRALIRFEAQECKIFVIYFSAIYLGVDDPLRKLHRYPSDQLNKFEGGQRDSQWTCVVEKLKELVDTVRSRHQPGDADEAMAQEPLSQSTVSSLAAWREARGKAGNQLRTLTNLWQPLIDALSTTSFDAVTWDDLAISTRSLRAQLSQQWPRHPLLPDRTQSLIDNLAATLATATTAESSRRQVRDACTRAIHLTDWLLGILTRQDSEEP
ncbi:MAG: toll/interleukin-1 receptor domain-containing protein [Pseudonocardiales bacterium]|nr:toll/interleukin-1 receptor domain-containing protein [Pseudonocardiales bacterium]